VSVLSAVVFLSFTVLTQSLAFWFGDFESGATTLFDYILNFSLYPQTIFQGFLKFITIFVMPGFFMANLPVSLITNFSWINLSQLSVFL
jgi:ABC-2 type transport system permease protein